MRNDVKLGFAIGGVLLAVLVVYVLVVPGSGAKNKVSLNATAKGAGGKVTLEPVNPAKPLPQAPPVSAPPQTFSPGAAHSHDVIADGNTAGGHSGSEAAKPAPTDPFASNSGSQDSGTALQSGDDHPGAGKAIEATKAGSSSPDWNRILNDQTTLIAQTPVVVNPVSDEHTTLPADLPGKPALRSDPAPAGPTRGIAAPLPDGPVSDPAGTGGVSTDPAAPSGGHVHTVASGETFSSISASAYGSPNFYPAIMRANPNIDPQHLKPGMKVTLPDVSQVKPAAAGGTGTGTVRLAGAKTLETIDPKKQYRVQPGDSLYRIAVRLYGKGTYSDKIFELNQQAMGGDETHLRPGQVLQLPEPPTQGQ
jgi:nucleoid-associated protein YgaU